MHNNLFCFQEALLEAKRRPVSSGVLLNSITPNRKYIAQHVTTTTTTAAPPLIRNPALYVPPLIRKKIPAVYIRPHSEPVDGHAYIPPAVPSTTPSPLYIPSLPEDNYLPVTTPSPLFRRPIVVPSQENLPPLEAPYRPIAVYEPSSTPASPTVDYGTPIAIYNNQPVSPLLTRLNVVSSTPSPIYPTPTLAGETIEQINNELEPPRFYPNQGVPIPSSTFTPDYSPISSTTARPPYAADAIPLFNRNRYASKPLSIYQSPVGDFSSNGLGDGYTPQFPYYDGVSATANGFQYYLPRQYHEENNLDPQRRIGSFGYIDPFGIRRVSYYNTSPENGIQIRKNNRYVGFNATPYDPRPL